MTEPDAMPEDTRIRNLYRRTLTEEPPAEVDHAVLAAARSAVTRPRHRSPVPWAVAATLVLSVGIGWHLLQLDQAQVTPPSTPKVEAVPGMGEPAVAPDARRETGDSAAPVGAAKDMGPQWTLREAIPANRAPSEPDHAERHSASAPVRPTARAAGECERYGLPEDAQLNDLRDAIHAARRAGDTPRVRCLEQQLRQRQTGSTEPTGTPHSAGDR